MAAAVSTSASASASASASNPAECSVCTDVITGNALVCAHCKYSSCTDCARHYWDDHPMNPPACMNCRKVFTLENLAMAFSKTAAHKGLENARREALFRAETAYGMETQTVLFPIIHVYEKLVNNLELKRLELEKTETEYWAARMRMYEARRECKRANITTAPSKRGRHDQNVKENAREECGRLHGRVTQMETEMMALYETVKRVHDIIAFTELRQVETTFRAFFRYQHHRCNFDDEDVRRFSPGLLRAQGETIDLTLDDADVGGAAPAADGTAEAVVPDALTTRQASTSRMAPCTRSGCMGLYTSTDGLCMVCRLEHCARCAKALSDPSEAEADGVAGAAAEDEAGPSDRKKTKTKTKHVCNAADVATAKFLATTTKPCPRCHAFITRAEGCAQMMCTNCHVIFNWNTMQEEKGVIHNPHFYQLSAELRQRIVDERAARGIAAGRTERFLQGVAPRAPLCNVDAEHDPLCVDFDAPVFLRLLEGACASFTAENRQQVMEAHRLVGHYAHNQIPTLERIIVGINAANENDTAPQFTERTTRELRIAYLRGGRPLPVATDMSVKEHPQKFCSARILIVDRANHVTAEHYKKQLMRMDTRRTNFMRKLETMRTYVAAAEDALRLFLASTPEERPALLTNILTMKSETESSVLMLARRTGGGTKRRRTMRGPMGAERLQAVGNAAGPRIAVGSDDEDDEDDFIATSDDE